MYCTTLDLTGNCCEKCSHKDMLRHCKSSCALPAGSQFAKSWHKIFCKFIRLMLGYKIRVNCSYFRHLTQQITMFINGNCERKCAYNFIHLSTFVIGGNRAISYHIKHHHRGIPYICYFYRIVCIGFDISGHEYSDNWTY